jgi:hypothetical protein
VDFGGRGHDLFHVTSDALCRKDWESLVILSQLSLIRRRFETATTNASVDRCRYATIGREKV